MLAITGIGAQTSLGRLTMACAAARAGILRPRPLAPLMVMDEDAGQLEPVTGHPASFLTRGFAGMARLARLGALALGDLLDQRALQPVDLADTALLLVLGSGYYLDCAEFVENERFEDRAPRFGPTPPASCEAIASERERIQTALPLRMLQQAGLPPAAIEELLFEDQPGVALALRRANELLSSGSVRRCLVGAIDTWCEPEGVEALDTLDLLKTPENPVGMVPGEAAVFLVLELATTKRAVSGRVDTRSLRVEVGEHQFSPGVHSCRRLGETINAAVSAARPAPRLWTVGTHNGTSWTAAEWGRSLVLLPPSVSGGPHWFPALSFGDTGAAATALSICMVVRAFERGYAQGDSALVWASGPRGGKAAFLIHPG